MSDNIDSNHQASLREIMDALVNANKLLTKYIGQLYSDDIDELVDEVNQERLERRKLVDGQNLLLRVICHCQFHDTCMDWQDLEVDD
jgi:hypothetical protein